MRGDARIINTQRLANRKHKIIFNPFSGSGAIVDPAGNPFAESGQDKIVKKVEQMRIFLRMQKHKPGGL